MSGHRPGRQGPDQERDPDDDPVLYFEHKFLYRRIKEDLPEGEEILTPIGKARLAREGKDLTIITWSAMVFKALEAAEKLEKEDGLSVEVLDLRTLLPMDDDAIMASVRKTNRVLIAHEDTRTGGVAGEITARINDQAFEWLDAPVKRVAAHEFHCRMPRRWKTLSYRKPTTWFGRRVGLQPTRR
jgi:2-oxoisovalerate dehydrogenase E1 component beta subunit